MKLWMPQFHLGTPAADSAYTVLGLYMFTTTAFSFIGHSRLNSI